MPARAGHAGPGAVHPHDSRIPQALRRGPSGAMLRATMAGEHHLHLVSDSTGDTLNAIARAALARFQHAPELHISVFIRTEADLAEVIAAIRRDPGAVLYTIADPQRREQLLAACRDCGINATAVLDPAIVAIADHLGEAPAERPGLQHRVSTDYFDRIAALDFAIGHDDGALAERLTRAQVVLTGVSRTSKTPTCIYLAYRGIRAANVPLLPKLEPAPALLAAIGEGVPVIGLTASPARLAQIRSQRLEALGVGQWPGYAEIEAIRAEVADARLFFDRFEMPVIDVTRRSIEETAAAILAILRGRGAVA